MYSITPIDATIKYAYIGHTINFKSRKSQHKNTCNCETGKQYNHKIYQIIREHKGFDNWEMKPLEEYECENKNQARIRERYWFDKYVADGYNMCNANTPYISDGGYEEALKGGVYYEKYYSKTGTNYHKNLERARERNRMLSLAYKENKRLKKLLDENNIKY